MASGSSAPPPHGGYLSESGYFYSYPAHFLLMIGFSRFHPAPREPGHLAGFLSGTSRFRPVRGVSADSFSPDTRTLRAAGILVSPPFPPPAESTRPEDDSNRRGRGKCRSGEGSWLSEQGPCCRHRRGRRFQAARGPHQPWLSHHYIRCNRCKGSLEAAPPGFPELGWQFRASVMSESH